MNASPPATATPIQVYGRNEISMLFASLQRTQQSPIGTVGAVRDGAGRF
ncbi:hypothetical protein J4732_11990 [Serratia marcescens]|uniref:Uncharacterized protein n=1 Tax=Serratia marcescens TaxID=615 RepID=A0A939NT18_SERMA|nr:hypothetical protein [Serratia marcescens]